MAKQTSYYHEEANIDIYLDYIVVSFEGRRIKPLRYIVEHNLLEKWVDKNGYLDCCDMTLEGEVKYNEWKMDYVDFLDDLEEKELSDIIKKYINSTLQTNRQIINLN